MVLFLAPKLFSTSVVVARYLESSNCTFIHLCTCVWYYFSGIKDISFLAFLLRVHII